MTNLQLHTEKRLFDFLGPKKSDIITLMGGETTYKKEVSFAIQAANANTQLQQASPESVGKAIYNLAITGLSLNPVLKLAYLTPRMVNGSIEALLMPSYQGLVKLLTDCGCVSQVYAHCRYKGDDFTYELGTEVTIKHTPNFQSKEIEGVYAVAVLPEGGKLVEYMPTKDVHEIRARSDGYRAFKAGKIKSNPWDSDEAEMFRKTVIRRIFKYVPKSPGFGRVAEAIKLDEQEFPATIGQISFIELLINNSTYDEDMRDIMRGKIESDCTMIEAENMIEDLQRNQLATITHTAQHSVTDAKEAVKNRIQ